MRFLKQFFFRFTFVLVRDTAVYRADFLTRFFAMESYTFGTKICFDFVEIFTFSDSSIRTLRLANATVKTFSSDKCYHFFSSSSKMLFQKTDTNFTKTCHPCKKNFNLNFHAQNYNSKL